MPEQIRTLIVGGGQAGLATSYHLKQGGHEHIILEGAAQAGNAWRNDRWDSFTLVTPNWTFTLPGFPYDGADPDGYLPRADIVARFERYVEMFKLPVQYNTHVNSVEQTDHGYRVRTSASEFIAQNVVLATGLFQKPKIPAFSAGLPHVMQLHSGSYANPGALPPGAVLVVGSAQSGCQIAEELYLSGRTVYLATGSAGRVPRRYRGKDCFYWLVKCGFFDRTPDKLPSSRARFAGNPQLSGKDGGHELNLHRFKRDGVVLLGRIHDARDGKAFFAPDLHDNLAKVDKLEADVVKLIDGYIAQNHIDAPPPEPLPDLRDGYDAPIITELDLASAGITSIIWAMGYAWDFSLVKLPFLDDDGYPVQQRGVTAYPGLYVMGLPWMSKYKSGLLLGVGEDAEYVASAIMARVTV